MLRAVPPMAALLWCVAVGVPGAAAAEPSAPAPPPEEAAPVTEGGLPAEVCFAGVQDPFDNGFLDDEATARLRERLVRLGPGCAWHVLRGAESHPSPQAAEILVAAAPQWRDPALLPALYGAFGRAILRPHRRRQDLAFGAAGAIAAMSGPGTDLLAPARRGECCKEWPGLALARYQVEWAPELAEAGPPPGDAAVLAAAEPLFVSCIFAPARAPADPLDPLGIRSGPEAEIAVGARCAERAALEAWQATGSDRWRAGIRGLTTRFETADMLSVAQQLERSWGQGRQAEGGAAATATRIPAAITEPVRLRLPAAALLLALLAGGALLARTERGRRLVFRLGAISVGLLLVLALEGVLALVGVPPGDARRPTPRVQLEERDSAGGVLFRDMRFGSFARERPPGRARVAVVGESSIFGPGLAGHETVPARLRQRLLAQVPCVEVVNLGQSGCASPTLRGLAITAVERLDSDLVVLYGGHNEVGDMRERDLYLGVQTRGIRWKSALTRTHLYGGLSVLLPSPDRLVRRQTAPAPPPDWANRYSQDFERAVDLRFEREVEDLVRAVLRHDRPLVLAVPGFNHHGLRARWWDPGPPPDRWPGRTDDVVALLRSPDAPGAVALAQAIRDADPTHPSPWFLLALAREKAGDLDGAEEAIWECSRRNHLGSCVTPGIAHALRRIARRHGLPLADAHAALHRAAGDHLPGFDLFSDYVHLSPRGAEVVAGEIAAAMDREGLTRKLAAQCGEAGVGE